MARYTRSIMAVVRPLGVALSAALLCVACAPADEIRVDDPQQRRIALTGGDDAGCGLSEDDSTAKAKAGDGGGGGPAESLGAGPRTTGDIRVLVALVNYDFDGDDVPDCPFDGPGTPERPRCGDPSSMSVDGARRVVFTNDNSLARYLQSVSFGKVTSVSGDVFENRRVTVRIPTPVPISSRSGQPAICSIRPEVLARIGCTDRACLRDKSDSDPTKYDYLIVHQPGHTCLFAGIAFIGSQMSLLNGLAEESATHTLVHEVGHSMGMPHSNTLLCSRCEGDVPAAWKPIVYRDVGIGSGSRTDGVTDFSKCIKDEYGDLTSVMGAGGLGHVTPRFKEKFGWLDSDPAASGPRIASAASSGEYDIDGYWTSRTGVKALRVPIGSDKSYTLDLRTDGAAGPFSAMRGWYGLRLRIEDDSSDYMLDLAPQCDRWLKFPIKGCSSDADCDPSQYCDLRPGHRVCKPFAFYSVFWNVADGRLLPNTTYIDPDRSVAIANVSQSPDVVRVRVTHRLNRAPRGSLVSPAERALVIDSGLTLEATFHEDDAYDCTCKPGECPDAARTVCNDPSRAGGSQSGHLVFEICAETDMACASPLQTGRSGLLTNGQSFRFDPPARLSDGLYYWRVRAIDARGAQSTSAVRSFIVNAAPSVPETSGPDSPDSNTRYGPTVTLSATFINEPSWEAGEIVFEICLTERCGDSLVATHRAAASSSGDRVSWRTTLSETGRWYYWRAKAVDQSSESRFSAAKRFLVNRDSECERWTTLAPMARGRKLHTATLLSDGRVLVVGGINFVPLSQAEIYQPTSNSWSAAARLAKGRHSHTATLLPDGRVLVVGGMVFDSTDPRWAWSTKTTEIFDPLTGNWTAAADMASGRRLHTATLLEDGRVLVSGGYDADSKGVNPARWLDTVQIYDYRSDSWTPPFVIDKTRAEHTATRLVLRDELLLAGSNNASGRTTERLTFDPLATRADVSLPASYAGHSATQLYDGNVLLAGASGSAQLLRVSSSTLSPVDGVFGRRDHSATLLPSGDVLLVAGEVGTRYQATALRYRRADNALVGAATLPVPSDTRTTADRSDHVATLLGDGRVLVTGGGTWHGTSGKTDALLYRASCGQQVARVSGMSGDGALVTATPLSSSGLVLVVNDDAAGAVDLYDPRSRRFWRAASLNNPRRGHTATALTTGKVLVAGGEPIGSAGPEAELYDPRSDTWSKSGAPGTPRRAHTATLLTSGEVALVGGRSGGAATASIEIYNPGTGAFRDAGVSLREARHAHSTTLLRDGRLLVVGGKDGSGELRSVEIVDLRARTSVLARSLWTARAHHSASLLGNGNVLVVGGERGRMRWASGVIYDVASDQWLLLQNSLLRRRSRHRATVLTGGAVLISGGLDLAGNPIAQLEIFDPASDGFVHAPVSLDVARSGHAAALTGDGEVVLIGGEGLGGSALRDAEIYADGRGHLAWWRPRITRVVGVHDLGPMYFGPPTRLRVEGSRLTGLSEGSSGGVRSSASNVPLVLLTRVDGGDTRTLRGTSLADDKVEATLPSGLANGVYQVRVVTGGVPSEAHYWVRQWPLFVSVVTTSEDPPVISR